MTKDANLHVKMSQEEKERLSVIAKGMGFDSLSAYARFAVLNLPRLMGKEWAKEAEQTRRK